MIIVAGTYDVAPEDRDAFLASRRERVERYRLEPGCLEYVWSIDPDVPGRVRLFERWTDSESLRVHLAAPRPSGGAADVEVIDRDVLAYEISDSAPL
jgi:quinol monooxygenase YgiN